MEGLTTDVRMAVADLNAEYAACLDGRWFEAWPDLFTDDCVYKLQPRGNHDRGLPLATMAFESKSMLRDRIYAVTQTLFHIPYSTRHVIGCAFSTAPSSPTPSSIRYSKTR